MRQLKDKKPDMSGMPAKARVFTALCRGLYVALVLTVLLVLPAFAAEGDGTTGDALGALDSLNTLIFGFIKAIGIGFAGFGVMQLAMSISSHDTSQRMTGLACVGGGVLMFFAKSILSAMGIA